MASSHTKRGVRPRIGPGMAGVRLSADEFDATPEAAWDDRYRYELIDGVLVVTPIPGAGARDPNGELEYLLRSYRHTRPEGGHLDATLSEQTIALGEQRRRADRALWCGLGRVPDLDRDIPTILVEFVSKSRRDVLRTDEQKGDDSLAAAVSEGWVIDRFRRIMSVSHRGPIDPDSRVSAELQSHETPLLPWFRASACPNVPRGRPSETNAETTQFPLMTGTPA